MGSGDGQLRVSGRSWTDEQASQVWYVEVKHTSGDLVFKFSRWRYRGISEHSSTKPIKYSESRTRLQSSITSEPPADRVGVNNVRGEINLLLDEMRALQLRGGIVFMGVIVKRHGLLNALLNPAVNCS